MRQKFMQELENILMDEDVDIEKIKSRIIIMMDKYEISERCTEVAVQDEDSVKRYVTLFLINKRVSGRTERTLDHYKNTLRRFFEEVQKNPEEITSDDIKLYLAMKEVRDKNTKVTQRNIMRVISSFYQWMVTEEYILKNPMNKVDEIKIKKAKKEAFTEMEIEQMRICIGDDMRLLCMFEILLSTWCRVSEIVEIKISEIRNNGEAVLIHGKGEKDRICYLNARAKLAIDRYMSMRKDNNEFLFAKCTISVGEKERVFSTECKKYKIKPIDWWKIEELVGCGHVDKGVVEKMIRKLGIKAGVKKVHPHRFRRTGATFALRKGMPIEKVSKLLGHESIETTQIYLDISEEELEQAHRKYV